MFRVFFFWTHICFGFYKYCDLTTLGILKQLIWCRANRSPPVSGGRRPPSGPALSRPGAPRGWCARRTRSGPCCCGRRCCTRRAGGSRDSPCGWWTWRSPRRGCDSGGSGRSARDVRPCLTPARSPWRRGASRDSFWSGWWVRERLSPTPGPWPGWGWLWKGCEAGLGFGSGGDCCWRYWSGPEPLCSAPPPCSLCPWSRGSRWAKGRGCGRRAARRAPAPSDRLRREPGSPERTRCWCPEPCAAVRRDGAETAEKARGSPFYSCPRGETRQGTQQWHGS